MSITDDTIRAWFKDHRAELTRCEELGLEILRWRKPGTSVFSMVFMTFGSHLLVLGDAGEAVYKWSEPITFEWVAGCYMGYVLSKCQASPEGRKFEDWDEHAARARLAQEFSDEPDRLARILSAAADHLDTRADWVTWMQDAGYLEEFFGESWYEHSDIGMGPTVQARAHVLGLQMAVAQLTAVPS